MLVSFILLLILIFINGILSSSEIAYLTLDKYRLNKNNKKDIKIYKMLKDENKFLSTIQIGITLAGFMASAFASDTFTDMIMKRGYLIVNEEFTESFLMIIITLILSYITLVFGELVPKKIGRAKAYKIATLTIDLISFMASLFYPIILLLSSSTNVICKLLHIKEHNEVLTEQDIKKLIVTGNYEGIVEEKEKEYLLNIFAFNDKEAQDIMKSRQDCVVIGVTDDKYEILNKIKDSHFTRYPVINNQKQILGFINIKDFIFFYQNDDSWGIDKLIHPILSFQKNDKIDAIFRVMQEKGENMALILDDKEFVGLLTLEDVIEEIVGRLEDEYSQKKTLQ